MADYLRAYQRTLAFEGGYSYDPQDPGGETYRGIARNHHPNWSGWLRVDAHKAQTNFPANLAQDSLLEQQLRIFYQQQFWEPLHAKAILDQSIAEALFDFAVNAGLVTSIKLAQSCVGATIDGVMGPQTLTRLNQQTARDFLAQFALQKIAHYVAICERRSSSKKYFYGWIKRTLEGL